MRLFLSQYCTVPLRRLIGDSTCQLIELLYIDSILILKSISVLNIIKKKENKMNCRCGRHFDTVLRSRMVKDVR